MNMLDWLRRNKVANTTDHNQTGDSDVASEIDAPTTAPPNPAHAPNDPSIVEATTLWTAYFTNQVAAENLYRDRELRITGVVAHVVRDTNDRIEVRLKAPVTYNYVYCRFPERARDAVARLQPDQQVVLTGRVKGMRHNTLTVVECAFVDEAEAAAG